MRAIAVLAVSSLTLAGLSGCAFTPRGPLTDERRDIDAVTAVVLDGDGDLTISEGAPALTVSAAAGVHGLLTSDVRDGALVLGIRPGTPSFAVGEVHYELTLPSLDRLEVNGVGDVESSLSGGDLSIALNGVGDVEFDGLDADLVEVSVSGAGDVTLSGTAAEQVIELSGTGDVDAEDLRTQRTALEVSGVGDVDVYATQELDVRLSGVGTVRHSGGAVVTQQVSGMGEVRADD